MYSAQKGGQGVKDAHFFGLDHAKEVFEESLDRDPVWDCTLISEMRNKKQTVVNAIYEWTDEEIWEYANDNNVRMNPLYPSLMEAGYCRIGCVGCPLASFKKQRYDFERWPAYKTLYIRAFDKMLEERRKSDHWKNVQWQTGEDVMTWWLGGDPNQMTIDQWLKEMDDGDVARQGIY